MADNPAREMFERGETICVTDKGAQYAQPYLDGVKIDDAFECSRTHIKRYRFDRPRLSTGLQSETLNGTVTIEWAEPEASSNG